MSYTGFMHGNPRKWPEAKPIQTATISNMEKAILEKAATGRAPLEYCQHCGSPGLQPAGACKVCPVCGKTTGCS